MLVFAIEASVARLSRPKPQKANLLFSNIDIWEMNEIGALIEGLGRFAECSDQSAPPQSAVFTFFVSFLIDTSFIPSLLWLVSALHQPH